MFAVVSSVAHVGVDVGAVNGGVTTGGPAGAAAEKSAVRLLADEDVACGNIRALNLGVAFEAEIVVALDQKLAIDGAVRGVADGATFAQGFMLEDKGPGLFSMTFAAALVQARHGQSSGRLHDFVAVRVVTLDAVHAALDDWMMVGESELSMDIEMAFETSRGVFAGVDNQFGAAFGRGDMLAGWPMARFTAVHAGELDVILAEAAVSAGWEDADDVRMTINASAVADEFRSFNLRGRNDRALNAGAGDENGHAEGSRHQHPQRCPPSGLGHTFWCKNRALHRPSEGRV
jgi:hypothetical protein